MGALYKHSAVRVSFGNCFFYCSASRIPIVFIIIIFFDFLAQLLAFLGNLFIITENGRKVNRIPVKREKSERNAVKIRLNFCVALAIFSQLLYNTV